MALKSYTRLFTQYAHLTALLQQMTIPRILYNVSANTIVRNCQTSSSHKMREQRRQNV